MPGFGPGHLNPSTIPQSRLTIQRWKLSAPIPNTVGITALLKKQPVAFIADTVGITASLALTGVFVQYDTWRPVPKPDNTIVLVCRTPEGTHDSAGALPYMTLWTLKTDGSNERPAVLSPATNGYGWTAYEHPEWSPDGNLVVLISETSTDYKLTLLNSSGFGQ